MDAKDFEKNHRMYKWAGIIRECRESGLSVKAYCANAGFHTNTYFYWQKKLRDTAYDIYKRKQTETNIIIPSDNTALTGKYATEPGRQTPAGWVSVGQKGRNTDNLPANARITIRRENWTITVDAGCDAALLTEALKAVDLICC